MSAQHEIDRQLGAARPPDPVGGDLDAASVRVLARLAMLETGVRNVGGEIPERPIRHGSWMKVAACAVLLLLASPSVPVSVPPSREPAATVPDPLVASVEAAIGGDVLARRRLLVAGPRVRTLLLDHAAAVPDDAACALALLRAAGGVRGDAEASRLADLAAWPGLREAAIDLLASAPTTAGVKYLARLLVELPEAEREVVDALLQAARHGRRGAACRALASGAAAGRVEAAAAAIRIGSGRSAGAVIAAVHEALLDDPRLAVACCEAPATTRDRLLCRAAGGDERSLRLIAGARLEGVIPLLEARAMGSDQAVARQAVDALSRQNRPEAWFALARALFGEAAAEVRSVLASAPQGAVDYLERVARAEPARRAFALEALAAAGGEGLLALERLCERPALRAPVVDALERAPGPGAVDLLAALAVDGGDTGRALVALGRRLEAGDRRAGRVLLAMARDGGSRRALRLLARHGAGAGLDWFERVAAEPSLPHDARVVLTRAVRRAREDRAGEILTAARRTPRARGVSPIT